MIPSTKQKDVGQKIGKEDAADHVAAQGEKLRSGLKSQQHQGSHQNGTGRIPRNGKSKRWNERSTTAGIVGRLGRHNTTDCALAIALFRRAPRLGDGIGREGGDDAAGSGQGTEERANGRGPQQIPAMLEGEEKRTE